MGVNRKRIVYPLMVISILLLSSGSMLGERYDYSLPRSRVHKSGGPMLSLVFAGDIMAHDVNYTRKPYDPIYEGIRDHLWEADLSFANLEFVFDPGKELSNYPNFNAPVGYVKAAIEGGFNVFSLANNHSLDMGSDSVAETLASIERLSEQHRIYYSGIVADAAERFEPLYFDISGVRIGFLAVTSFLNKLISDDNINVVPFYEDRAADLLVERLQRDTKKADVFILSYHGGGEYKPEPKQWKRDLFLRFINAGVDIVWGHHTHVAQPWETVSVQNAEKLILYSTGNLISGQTWTSGPDNENSDRNGTGESALFTVQVGIEDTTAAVKRVTAIPVFNHRDAESGMVVKRFDNIAAVELTEDWALYYNNRLSDLRTRLYDNSPWDFLR